MRKYKVSFVRYVEAEDELEAIENAIMDSSFPNTQDIYNNFSVEESKNEKEN